MFVCFFEAELEGLDPISDHPYQHHGLGSRWAACNSILCWPKVPDPYKEGQRWVLLRLLTLEGRFWWNLSEMCSHLLHLMGLSSEKNDLLSRQAVNHLPRENHKVWQTQFS